jgi:hypothetical protein
MNRLCITYFTCTPHPLKSSITPQIPPLHPKIHHYTPNSTTTPQNPPLHPKSAPKRMVSPKRQQKVERWPPAQKPHWTQHPHTRYSLNGNIRTMHTCIPPHLDLDPPIYMVLAVPPLVQTVFFEGRAPHFDYFDFFIS